MAVVDQEVDVERGGGEIVDAAGAVGGFGEDEDFAGPAEGAEDIG